MKNEDTIVALATPTGIGAIGIIRVSGPETICIVNEIFKAIAHSPLHPLRGSRPTI